MNDNPDCQLNQIDTLEKRCNEIHDIGWNAALDRAAFRLEHDFQQSFGKDTLTSIAVYLRSMKK